MPHLCGQFGQLFHLSRERGRCAETVSYTVLSPEIMVSHFPVWIVSLFTLHHWMIFLSRTFNSWVAWSTELYRLHKGAVLHLICFLQSHLGILKKGGNQVASFVGLHATQSITGIQLHLVQQIVYDFPGNWLAIVTHFHKSHRLAFCTTKHYDPPKSNASWKSTKITPITFPRSIFTFQVSLRYNKRDAVETPFLYPHWFFWSTLLKWWSILYT